MSHYKNLKSLLVASKININGCPKYFGIGRSLLTVEDEADDVVDDVDGERGK